MNEEKLKQETVDCLNKLKKVQPEVYLNLYPLMRIDKENTWYVIFSNDRSGRYEIHWYEGNSSNDIKTSKIDVRTDFHHERDALNWTIGYIQSSSILKGIKPPKIWSIIHINEHLDGGPPGQSDTKLVDERYEKLSSKVNLYGGSKKVYNNLHEEFLLDGNIIIDAGAYLECEFMGNPSVWGFDGEGKKRIVQFEKDTPSVDLLAILKKNMKDGDVLHIQTIPKTDSAAFGKRNRAIWFRELKENW